MGKRVVLVDETVLMVTKPVPVQDESQLARRLPERDAQRRANGRFVGRKEGVEVDLRRVANVVVGAAARWVL